ncbi:MAG: hypothetical protein HYV75_06175, partial [Opitutae bacterium]|nr:hypothetical protein [Opitutae bacterium]
NLASALRVTAANATAHGDLLFTFPGLNSFHGWTGLPTPTLANTTHWFSLLTPEQQEEIAAALTRSLQPVLVVQRGLLDFLARENFPTASPLQRYLLRNFVRVFSVDQYEFWVRRGRVVAPLATAWQLRLAAPRPGESPAKLELVVTFPAPARVARLELATLDARPQVLARWDQAGAPLTATGLNLKGEAVAPPISPAWDRPLPPVAHLSLPLAQPLVFDRKNTVVYVRDAAGAVLAEARFTD